MSSGGVPKEKIQKVFQTDRTVIFASILLMLGTLTFVLMNILPKSPPGVTRTVMIVAAVAVSVLATFALLRVLSHLTRHKEALYSEDIRALEDNRHSV